MDKELLEEAGCPSPGSPGGLVLEYDYLGSHRGNLLNGTLNVSSVLLYFRAHLGP